MGSVDEARAWLAAHGVTLERPPDREPADPPNAPRPVDFTADPGEPAATDGDSADDRAADPDADPEAIARGIVLRKLAARGRTRHELAQALAAKQVPEAVSRSVLDHFQRAGLVDDAVFAADWVESRQGRRHLSAAALRRELRAKGVDSEHIDAALTTVDAEDEYAAALDLVRRRQRAMDQLPREVQYRRLAGMLGRRGFSHAAAARVLAELLGPA